MKMLKTIACALCAILTTSCGYHLGGLKNSKVEGMKTCCVHMFGNKTFHPSAAMQMTSALTNAIQTEGTFKLTSPGNSDMYIEGEVVSAELTSVRTNLQDTYVSDAVSMAVSVSYRVVDAKTGKPLVSGQAQGSANCYIELGNAEAAKEDAVSYAVRKAADSIVESLTMP